ncbi:MAG: glycosyltransferase [Planctomycetaceae bacterium]
MPNHDSTALLDRPDAASDDAPQAREESPSEAIASSTKPARAAYILSRFPKLTETFVLYEILALEAQGTDVEIFPLLSAGNASTAQGASLFRKMVELVKKPGARPVMHADAAPLVARAHYHPLMSFAVLSALLQMAFLRPRAFFGVLYTLIRANLGSPNFLLGGLAVLPKCCWIAREMERANVTHVHAHFANHPAAAAFMVHRLAGISYSFTAHGSDLHMDRHMLREKVQEAEKVITISRYNRDLILEECGSEFAEKVQIIHCGVDTSVFAARNAATTKSNGLFEVLCIGTMHEVKGQTYLLEACKLLADRGVDVRCHLVGKGPDWDALKAQVRDAKLEDRVVFHGLMNRSQIAELVSKCDVLAAPSVPTEDGRREGIPVVLMEAMASELPVVASRLSGIPELVDDGVSGLLTTPRDASAIADALEQLSRDPELRRELGKAGRVKVLSEFDVHRNAAKLADCFGIDKG